MNHKSKVRQLKLAGLAGLVVIGGMQVVCAQTSPEPVASIAVASQTTAVPAADPAANSVLSAASAQPVVLTADEAKQSATGNVAELQQMMHGSELSELRTTYNGSYGASLLFYGKEMTWYVALFQQKNFWRVIKTSDEGRAEAIYRDFAHQTVQLSDVEIRRTRLDAQKAFTERMVALSQDRANRLQADLTVARQQQAIVADQQKQNRDEAAALATQKLAAQEQLRTAQRQVRDLQRQLESGLPVSR
ncbi:DUF2968 domain-containing protein [Paraburkholderia saeva]|jgi:hypothetical protein|uniref:DUF2968 domain-containing protein n=1 Tax=Paraburkholderia saeva TaxID=2777537 RepID=A0A9N8RXK7_9BURK|nr:DUF2968 domain-containing protein [Paraburkholderia saeva]CAG4891206.1 hypothetical protein R52603_01142 [Paraburkholderia saeva]CAG4896083.1 hypothetical protein R70241_02133 [Paraburkholderia saeva]CAG4902557.1 hypothetical protein LMG31841_03120 [Paraburkholderia saeva]